MTLLSNQLELERCPHCNVDKPNLPFLWEVQTTGHSGDNPRMWRIYKCGRCGGLITAFAVDRNAPVRETYPFATKIDDSIPQTAKSYLNQALNSLHAPAGAVMLAASAVDSMLKAKEYKDGSLYERINKAAQEHLITDDMAKWAHQIRLEANDQRHVDEQASIPDNEDAKKCIDFAMALAEFLFVLPSKVTRGLTETQPIN